MASVSAFLISRSVAPSNTGVANCTPSALRRPAQVGFQNLTDVHTGGNAQRIEHDLDRRSIRQVRHVLFRQDARDHALVPVAAGHLVADRQLALHGDVDLDQLDDARRQFVALAQLGDLLVGDLFEHRDLARRHLFDFVDLFVEPRVLVGQAHALQVARLHLLDDVARQLGVLGEQALVGLFVVQVGQQLLAFQQAAPGAWRARRSGCGFRPAGCAAGAAICDSSIDFDALVLLLALAGEDLAIDDRAFDARRAVERRVLHVAGLFAEDRAEQFLFRSELGFALRA